MSELKALDKDYLRKRSEKFEEECIKIIDAIAPELDTINKKLIACRISILRLDMEVTYTKELLDEVYVSINNIVNGRED